MIGIILAAVAIMAILTAVALIPDFLRWREKRRFKHRRKH